MKSTVIIFLLALIETIAAFYPPTSLQLSESKYSWVHVGRPGRGHHFHVNFRNNVSRFSFSPFEYGYTSTDDSEVVYFGAVPVRVPYTVSTIAELAFGHGAPFWINWRNYTLAPSELVFGSPTAASLLSIPRCGLHTPPPNVTFDVSTEETTLPPEFFHADKFIVRIGPCNVTVHKSDAQTRTSDGIGVDMRRRGPVGGPIILGRPVIAHHFVLFQDMQTGELKVGVSPEITDEISYLYVIVYVLLVALFSVVALTSIHIPGTDSWKTQKTNLLIAIASISAGIVALVATVYPGSLELARLRFSGLFPASVGVGFAVVFVIGVSMLWATPWIVSAGLATLWLYSLWDLNDFIGAFYRLLWPTLLADWQCMLALMRGGKDIPIAIATIAFAVLYGAWPPIARTFGLIKFGVPLCLVFYVCGTIIMPVMLFYIYALIRQVRKSPLNKDLFVPIQSRLFPVKRS